MKRRSFLAMLGLAPVAAVAKQLPDPIQLEPKKLLSVDEYRRNAIAKAMKETNRNFAVAVYDKLRSRDGKLEMTKDGEIKMFI